MWGKVAHRDAEAAVSGQAVGPTWLQRLLGCWATVMEDPVQDRVASTATSRTAKSKAERTLDLQASWRVVEGWNFAPGKYYQVCQEVNDANTES